MREELGGQHGTALPSAITKNDGKKRGRNMQSHLSPEQFHRARILNGRWNSPDEERFYERSLSFASSMPRYCKENQSMLCFQRAWGDTIVA